MRRGLIFLMGLILLGTAGKCTKEEEQSMYYEFDKDYTLHQVDSVCRVEGIPGSQEYWLEGNSLVSGSGVLSQRAYILNDSTFYILTEIGDSTWNFKKKVIRTRR